MHLKPHLYNKLNQLVYFLFYFFHSKLF
jgi:hypothetical protein